MCVRLGKVWFCFVLFAFKLLVFLPEPGSQGLERSLRFSSQRTIIIYLLHLLLFHVCLRCVWVDIHTSCVTNRGRRNPWTCIDRWLDVDANIGSQAIHSSSSWSWNEPGNQTESCKSSHVWKLNEQSTHNSQRPPEEMAEELRKYLGMSKIAQSQMRVTLRGHLL